MKLAAPGRDCAVREEIIVSARRIMNFAAGLRDDNPRYFDDSTPGTPLASPTFPVGLTWTISRRLDEIFTAQGWPADAFRRQLHTHETLRLERPIHAGDRISLTARPAAMRTHRRGCLLTMRTDGSDTQGRAVFTEWHTVLLPGFEAETLADEAADAEPPHVAMPADGRVPSWEESIPIGPLAGHIYDGCADIHFPVHTSIDYARQTGWPRPILHGTATLGLALKELVNRELHSDPASIHWIGARFLLPVFAGSTLRLRCFDEAADHAPVRRLLVITEDQIALSIRVALRPMRAR